MGNRRLGTRRLETVLDNLIGHSTGGLNGSPFIIKDPQRYYVEEYFTDGIPQLQAILDGTYNTEATRIASRTMEVIGNSAQSADVTRTATVPGVRLGDNGAGNGHAAVLIGHQDQSAAMSAMGAAIWGTENECHFECLIRTGTSIATQTWGAGFLNNASQAASSAVFNHGTGDNAAYFVYGDTDDDTGTLADNTKLYFVTNHGAGNDVRVKLPITVAASTTYRLGIQIDASRQVSIFVDGVQYSLQPLTAAAEYNSAGVGTQKSGALTDNINLLPAVGIQQQTTDQRTLDVSYMKCSRVSFDN